MSRCVCHTLLHTFPVDHFQRNRRCCSLLLALKLLDDECVAPYSTPLSRHRYPFIQPNRTLWSKQAPAQHLSSSQLANFCKRRSYYPLWCSCKAPHVHARLTGLHTFSMWTYLALPSPIICRWIVPPFPEDTALTAEHIIEIDMPNFGSYGGVGFVLQFLKPCSRTNTNLLHTCRMHIVYAWIASGGRLLFSTRSWTGSADGTMGE